HEQLVEANIYLDSNKVKIVRGMLEELRLSWEKAIETLRKDKGEVREVASPKVRQIPTGGLDIAG
ncbi:MAG TPA: flagellar export chaperone FliS, partial [Thermosynergistes sp.]|nr:flagellar export chaperone FliS [Thermosynergistes sp.]